MRCHICDGELKDQEIKIDPRTGKYRACNRCWDVIQDTLDTYQKPDELEIDTTLLPEIEASLEDVDIESEYIYPTRKVSEVSE